MDTASLPREIIFPILRLYIPTVPVFQALNLRLLCHELDDEVSNILFSDGMLDERYLPADENCRTCHQNVRPERWTRAINEATVHRYIKALLKKRQLSKGDARCSALAPIKTALETIRERLQPPRKAYATMFTRAIITLLGVRTAWSFLGPHHSTCLRETRHLEARTPLFWVLVCAAYADDRKLVGKCLKESNMSTALDSKHYIYMDYNEFARTFKSESVQQIHYVESIAAAYTIAIRMGHSNLIKIIESLEYSKSAAVLGSIKYFNNLPVYDVASMTTASSNPAIASTAAKIVTRLLLFKERAGDQNKDIHLRAVTHIPLSSGVLEEALNAVFPHTIAFLRNRICIQIVCRAALTNDMKLATFIVKFMQAQSNLFQPRPRNNYHWIKASRWTDECGIRQDRLLDSLQPLRVALATSSLDVLNYLLKIWPSLRRYVHWMEKSNDQYDSLTSYRTLSTQRISGRETKSDKTLDVDARIQAVRDVFIEPEDRIPGYKFRNKASVLGLEAILLDSIVDKLSWGPLVVHAAGLADSAILQTFVSHVNLKEPLPYAIVDSKPIYISGDPATTVGERAFQHAYQLGRVDNVRILLAAGVRPPAGVHGPMYSEDDFEAALNALRMRQLLAEYKLVSAERTLRVPYLLVGKGGKVGGNDEATLSEIMKQVHDDADNYIWKLGQKDRRKDGYAEYDWSERKVKDEPKAMPM